MNEDKAKSILDGAIKENNLLHRYVDYIYWDVSNEKITLDGEFTAD